MMPWFDAVFDGGCPIIYPFWVLRADGIASTQSSCLVGMRDLLSPDLPHRAVWDGCSVFLTCIIPLRFFSDLS